MRLANCPVHTSKYRNLTAKSLSRDKCFDNILVTQTAYDSHFSAVNPKFLAIVADSTGASGAFIVISHTQAGQDPLEHVHVYGHKGPVLDIAWCPHDDNIIASGAEDGVVKVWLIPDKACGEHLTEPTTELLGHKRRVGIIKWHPTALNVLLSASADLNIYIWNVGTARVISEITVHPTLIYSVDFNWDGSKLLTTCKDGMVRIINPRNGVVEKEALCHESSRTTCAIFLRNGHIFTTGFSRSAERQYTLRSPDALAKPIVCVGMGSTATSVVFPFYDPDTSMIFLCGKGDFVLRYFEIISKAPFVQFIGEYHSPDTERAICMMPKRGCNAIADEVDRFYRFNKKGFCQVISVVVPRLSKNLKKHANVKILAGVPSISAGEWMQGTNRNPIMATLKLESQSETEKNTTPKRNDFLSKEEIDDSTFTGIKEVDDLSSLFGEKRDEGKSGQDEVLESLSRQPPYKRILTFNSLSALVVELKKQKAAERIAAERVVSLRLAAERLAAERITAERTAAESKALETKASESTSAKSTATVGITAEIIARYNDETTVPSTGAHRPGHGDEKTSNPTY